jgi:hypothetical protein
MDQDSTPPDGGTKQDGAPFLMPKVLSFRYRVSYTHRSRIEQIEYQSPHEVILNLRNLKDNDTITYINVDNGGDAFTITVDRFKVMVAQTVFNSSADEIEALYVRLLLTNHYSNSITDKGQLKEIDHRLCNQLGKIKSGYDYYRYESNHYLKYRRLSINYLRSILPQRYDVKAIHINLPSTIPNSWLFRDALNLSIPDSITRIYTFSPVPEDNIITTPIPGIPQRIIRIINTLIK